MEVGGRVCAVGGVARRDGRRIAFADLDDVARRHPVVVGRAARRFLHAVEPGRYGMIFAEADPAEPGAVRWLTSLGFQPVADRRGVYRWQG